MKKFVTFFNIFLLAFFFSNGEITAQYFEQGFADALTAGNSGGGTVISNASVTSDAVYVNSSASANQFTYLSTNNDAASIEINGDGVMRLVRAGSGTVYIVRNVNFSGPPTSLQVSFDFFTVENNANSSSAIQFMLGSNFLNSNNEPGATDKHSRFFINTKSTPSNTWGVTPESGSSSSAYTTTETVTWVINNSGSQLDYLAPDGSTESLADDAFDVWIGNTKEIDDAAALTADVALNNFEIRIAGGNGTYTIDNISISDVPLPVSGPGFFRTKANGNWDDAATWESSEDGNTWADASTAPSGSEDISITDTVTVETEVSVSGYITVEDPGHLTVGGGSISFEDGSTYEHARNGGSIPVATWETGSTLLVNAVTNTMPGNRNQSFYNIVWDCPNQSGNFNMGFDDVTIGGDITINNTGASRWYLCGPVTNDTAIVTINGNITLVDGNFAAHGTGNSGTVVIVTVNGNITALAGNFSITRGSQGGTGTTDFYLNGSLFSLANVTTQNSNPTGAKFIFSGNGIQTLSFDEVSFGGGGCPVQVDSGSTLNVGTSEFAGSGIFTLNPGATLQTANEGGLDSTLKNTGTITLSSEANFVYNGTTSQVTGNLLPSTVNDLEINNAAGVSLSKDVQVDGELNIVSGDLDLDSNNITLGENATLTESAGNTVKGLAGKITTTRSLNAPSGVNVGGLGVVITSASDLGSTLIERFHFAGTGGGNEGILRQFNISPANNSGLNATLRLYYDESELNSIPENELVPFKSLTGEDDSWLSLAGLLDVTENYVEVTGVDDLSYWTLAGSNTPVPVELSSFSATTDGRFVQLNWTTASELNNSGWDVERRIKNSDNSFSSWSKAGFVKGAGTASDKISYSFSDKNIASGTYQYRLKQIDLDGTTSYSEIVEVLITGPKEFSLFQNYPNPFNPETIIRFELPVTSFVNLTIYNSIGEEVETLINQQMESGVYLWNFNGANYPSGMYIYKLTAGEQTFSKKMILMK